MRHPMSSHFLPYHTRKIDRSRRMRERRTAQALVLFGIVLACVELYVVLASR